MQYRLLCVVSCALMLGSGVSQAQEREPQQVVAGSSDEALLRGYAEHAVTLPSGASVDEVGANHRRVRVPIEPDPEDIAALPDDLSKEEREAEIQKLSESVYTEIASGLNYWDSDSETWSETIEAFEVYEDAFVADRGPTKVILGRSMLGAGDGVDLLTEDGERLVSEILGLAYYDRASGQSVMIADLQETEGLLLPPNEVVYLNAFEGDVSASIRYIYLKGEFHQEIILEQQPPLPEEYGLSSATTTLEVWTEFAATREPGVQQRRVKEDGPQDRNRFASPDIFDEELDFGRLQFVEGKAFALTDNEVNGDGGERREVPTTKLWRRLEADDSRRVLIESVEIAEIAVELDALPKPRANVSRRPVGGREPLLAAAVEDSPRRIVDASGWRLPEGALVPEDERPLMAFADLAAKPAYVLDYVTISGNQSDYTFKGDETYYITAPVTLTGTTTFEGGTVIKYKRYTSSNHTRLLVNGNLEWKADMYRPVTLTAEDDNTIGQYVSGNTLGGFYARVGFLYNGSAPTIDLSHLRVRYAVFALSVYNVDPDNKISHSQFVGCDNVIWLDNGTDISFENVLIDDTNNRIFRIDDTASSVSGSHLTIANGGDLYWDNDPEDWSIITLENSLLYDLDQPTEAYNGKGSGHVIELSSSQDPFQSMGAGEYYLKGGSPYRDIGTTSIDAGLLAELAGRTTHPGAIVQSVTITEDAVWEPLAPRDDNGLPDLGYHYPPIDYAVNYADIDGARLTVRPGTAIAQFGLYGLRVVRDDSELFFEGTVEDRIKFARFDSIQEQPDRWGGGSESSNSTYMMIRGLANPSGGRVVDLRFADISLGDSAYQYSFHAAANSTRIGTLNIKDCRFYNGQMYLGGYNGDDHTLINNLFEQGSIYLTGKASLSLYNNLYHGVFELNFNQTSGSDPWYVRDNVFYDSYLSLTSISYNFNDHNAYKDTNVTTIGGTYGGGSDLDDPDVTFVSGPFGDWYQTEGSDLKDAGSRTVSNAGLAHHTAFSHQTKDTDDVDLGFHYPATAPSDDLIGQWGFNEGTGTTTEDASGNGHDGTLVNGAGWTDGVIGSAVAFDGSNDRVDVANTTLLEVGNGGDDFSLAFWFRLREDHNTNWRVITHKGTSGTTRTWAIFLRQNDNKLYFRVSTAGYWDEGATSASEVPLNEWVHIAYVKEGNHLRLYLNGVEDGSDTLGGSPTVSNSGTAYFGDSPWNSAADSDWDEVFLYDRALNPSEVGLLAGLNRALDTDGDGIADYIEDANGDFDAPGNPDTGETDWQVSENGTAVSGGELQVFTRLED